MIFEQRIETIQQGWAVFWWTNLEKLNIHVEKNDFRPFIHIMYKNEHIVAHRPQWKSKNYKTKETAGIHFLCSGQKSVQRYIPDQSVKSKRLGSQP